MISVVVDFRSAKYASALDDKLVLDMIVTN